MNKATIQRNAILNPFFKLVRIVQVKCCTKTFLVLHVTEAYMVHQLLKKKLVPAEKAINLFSRVVQLEQIPETTNGFYVEHA